jgi:hypothetical protein
MDPVKMASLTLSGAILSQRSVSYGDDDSNEGTHQVIQLKVPRKATIASGRTKYIP